MFILGSGALAYYLITWRMYRPATGWVIICLLLLLCAAGAIIPPGRDRGKPEPPREIRAPRLTGDPEAPVVVFKSSDPVQFQMARLALVAEGLDCVVLDEEAAALMSFLPEVEMRLAVPEREVEEAMSALQRMLSGDHEK